MSNILVISAATYMITRDWRHLSAHTLVFEFDSTTNGRKYVYLASDNVN